MKLYSSEIRWFSNEKKGLLNIFNDISGTTFKEEERTDSYLRTYSRDLGIKIRGEGGRLEMKWLIGKRSEFHFKNKFPGTVENWIKTGFETNDPILDSCKKKSENASDWINIKKKRCKKKFEILSDDSILVLTEDRILTKGCELEFTEILMNNKHTFYTLGFESFADKNKCRKYLDLSLAFCQDHLKPDILKKLENMAYPHFIILYDQREQII